MKITSFNSDVENISKLSNRPNIEEGYTAEVLKALFDKAGIDIKNYINSVLIEELASSALNSSGARKIGSEMIDTVPGDNVQEKLEALSSQINGLAQGTIPDGSVTPEKFAPDVEQFLLSASIRAEIYKEVGTHTFTVQRAGKYKITLVGGGAGGGINPANHSHSMGGGGGASLILWCDLQIGDECSVTVGNGGEGLVVDGQAFVAHSQNGSDTTFSVNGQLIATAGGGKIGVGARGEAVGGDINYSGGYPRSGYTSLPERPSEMLCVGGDSILGFGGAFETDVVGIGGGGYCGWYMSGSYGAGQKGGDGCAVIEYMK